MKPIAFMGKRWTDVTAKILLVSLCLIFFIRPIQVNAETESLQFYVFSCPTCEGLEERMHVLEDTYPQGTIIFFDVAEGNNSKRFNKISEILGKVLFMPLVGIFKDGAITAVCSGALSANDWQKSITEAVDGVPVYIAETENQMEISVLISDPYIIETVERLFTDPEIVGIDIETSFLQLFFIVTAAATIDAINPCSFSIFVILLTFVFYDVDKKSVMKIGLSFTFGVFLAYTLVGLGLSVVFQRTPGLKYLVSPLTFVFGVLRILDSLGKDVKYLPETFSRKISTRIEQVFNPRNSFWAGILVGFLMLPCSSAPYFTVLSLLAVRASIVEGFALLGYYNLIIIVPFIVITLIIHGLVRSTMDLKLWSLENQRGVNLLMGIALVLLSILNLIM
ncbi:MAG: sulfite exporter TauE/SafE family protein [Candidatus Bathyarchaeota archaeon]|nr:sulfite exporter TauE/SafE family protein [Candidatus Bathyarchaeota archaeon]